MVQTTKEGREELTASEAGCDREKKRIKTGSCFLQCQAAKKQMEEVYVQSQQRLQCADGWRIKNLLELTDERNKCGEMETEKASQRVVVLMRSKSKYVNAILEVAAENRLRMALESKAAGYHAFSFQINSRL